MHVLRNILTYVMSVRLARQVEIESCYTGLFCSAAHWLLQAVAVMHIHAFARPAEQYTAGCVLFVMSSVIGGGCRPYRQTSTRVKSW